MRIGVLSTRRFSISRSTGVPPVPPFSRMVVPPMPRAPNRFYFYSPTRAESKLRVES